MNSKFQSLLLIYYITQLVTMVNVNGLRDIFAHIPESKNLFLQFSTSRQWRRQDFFACPLNQMTKYANANGAKNIHAISAEISFYLV